MKMTTNSFPPPDLSIGFIYNSPQTGSWTFTDVPLFICCNNQLRVKSKSNTSTIDAKHVKTEYNYHLISVNSFNSSAKNLTYELYDLNGRLINQGTWAVNEESSYQLKKQAVSGIYLLKILIGNQYTTVKILNY